MPDGLVAETDGLAVVEIADVLRDESLAAARDGDRILQIGAGGDDARPVRAEVDRVGNEAARAPQIGRRAVDNSRTTESSALTTIARPWVTIRSATPEAAFPRPRRTRPAARRRDWRWSPRARGRSALIAPRSEVGRAGKRVQHEPVQRRIGEHQADVGEVRRDARGEETAAPREHDRARAIAEQRALGGPIRPDARRSPDSRPSPRKAWRRALFAGARSGPRLRRARRTGDESPPSPLSATIFPLRNAAATSLTGLLSFGPQRGMRSARRGSGGSPDRRSRARTSSHIGNGAIEVCARS